MWTTALLLAPSTKAGSVWGAFLALAVVVASAKSCANVRRHLMSWGVVWASLAPSSRRDPGRSFNFGGLAPTGIKVAVVVVAPCGPMAGTWVSPSPKENDEEAHI